MDPNKLCNVSPIIHSTNYITLTCRNCNNLFQRRFNVQPTSNEYYRCDNCRGLRSVNIQSLCLIQ